MKKKCDISIDRLKICYLAPPYLWDYLQNDANLKFYDFTLIHHDDEISEGKERKSRVFDVVLTDGRTLGTLTLTNKKLSNSEYCFFEFSNQMLYSDESINREIYGRQNCMVYLPIVSETLNLKFHNITLCEVACDVNWNVINKIRKMIHDYETYDMFVNGNIIKEHSRQIDNYMECYSRSRKQLNRRPTLYFRQATTDTASLKIYDKTREVEMKGNAKDYIKNWLNFESNDIFRTEVTLHKNDFKFFAKQKFADERWNDLNESLGAIINDENYIIALWIVTARRLLYFRNKTSREYIYLEDLL